jgi:hypothetical protein
MQLEFLLGLLLAEHSFANPSLAHYERNKLFPSLSWELSSMKTNAVRILLGVVIAFLFAVAGPSTQSVVAQGGGSFSPQKPTPPFPGIGEKYDFKEIARKGNEEMQKNIAASSELGKSIMQKAASPVTKTVNTTINYFYYGLIGASVLIALVAFGVLILKSGSSTDPRERAMNDPWIRARLEGKNSPNDTK